MEYSFKTSKSRKNSNSEKYQAMQDKFGTTEIEPLWIADMDIDLPSFIKEAIYERVEESSFGYEIFSKDAFQSQIDWLNKYYDTSYEIDEILYFHSVISSLNVAIETFSNIGDNIIIQTPVYEKFFKSINSQNREVLYNPLIKSEDGYYQFDLEGLKNKINNRTKLLILCNPANPVGRAWSKKELKELVNICIKYNIIVFSDEVHCDLVYEPNRHIAFSQIKGAKNITISAYSIGKTFNLSGLACSTIFIQNRKLKEKFLNIYNKYYFAKSNIISHTVFKTVYSERGYIWLKELKKHLYNNYLILKKIVDKYPKLIKITPLESTYLAWLDCSGLKFNDKELNNFFIKEIKIGLNKGVDFGKDGKNFMRLNFAISEEKIYKISFMLDKILKKYL